MTAEVRAEVRAALLATGVDDPGDLELAVSEVVANAHRHGRPPVEVHVAVTGTDVEVLVRDAGEGPRALGPAPVLAHGDAVRGRGRWLAHRLATVQEVRTCDGFEVRLRRLGEHAEDRRTTLPG